jgi:hypothetical protein
VGGGAQAGSGGGPQGPARQLGQPSPAWAAASVGAADVPSDGRRPRAGQQARRADPRAAHPPAAPPVLPRRGQGAACHTRVRPTALENGACTHTQIGKRKSGGHTRPPTTCLCLSGLPPNNNNGCDYDYCRYSTPTSPCARETVSAP